MGKKRICVVVTARASYSRFKTALTAIREHEKLELILIAAASALLDRYGSAIDVMEADGFTIAGKVYNVVESGNLTGQAKTTGLGIIELANVFENQKPDVVVTIADRYETMSTAIAASYMNIPLVHIQGGEVTGNIDEKVRHAITKLSDLHLVATEKAKERVLKMGENVDKVFVTGCPSIDLAKNVATNQQLNFDPYLKYGGVGGQPDFTNGYIILLQHAVTSEFESARKHVEETLQAIIEIKLPAFVFWPNADAGSDGTSKGIRAFREQHEIQNIHFFKNMEPEDFLIFLRNSRCIIGNSSVGVRESSFLGVPAVNIGSRQNNRERGENVIDVAYDKVEIIEAINSQLKNGHYKPNDLYGSGNSGITIANLIADTDLGFTKKITY